MKLRNEIGIARLREIRKLFGCRENPLAAGDWKKMVEAEETKEAYCVLGSHSQSCAHTIACFGVDLVMGWTIVKWATFSDFSL